MKPPQNVLSEMMHDQTLSTTAAISLQGLDELDFVSPGLTRSQRFQRLMETAGLSVAVVAVTNVVAFGLGAISAIPAIHWCGR